MTHFERLVNSEVPLTEWKDRGHRFRFVIHNGLVQMGHEVRGKWQIVKPSPDLAIALKGMDVVAKMMMAMHKVNGDLLMKSRRSGMEVSTE